jgi:hypothetical protein
MATRVQNKRSSVAGNIPGPSDLDVGALAINFADRYIYTKNGSNAVIRLTGHIPVVQPVDEIVGDSYIDPTTGKLYSYFSLNGDPNDWNEIAPPEDLTPFVKHDGSVNMTGPLVLSGTASGSQALGFSQATTMIATALTDYLKKDGTVTMTGRLTLSADPTDALHAATKQYVDAQVSGSLPDLSDYLPKVGGVMTGQITLPGGGTGNQAATANELAAGFVAHVALPDPHTQYATNVELNNHIATGASQHPVATSGAHGFMSSTDKTLYVRDDGNDANDGLTDTAGGAFLTWQAAIDFVASIDFNGFTVTIRCDQAGPVSFTGVMVIPAMVGQKDTEDFLIQGDTTTPANCIINSSTTCITIQNARCKITGFKLQSSAGNAITATGIGCEFLGGVFDFGVVSSTHILVSSMARVQMQSSYSISGNASAHIVSAANAFFSTSTITVTVGASLTFGAFAQVGGQGYLGASSITFSTTVATGGRALGSSNGFILTGSGAQTWFPGNANGTFTTGSQLL